nr:hypothetical protein 49p1_00277 [Yersinia frederiksenii]
MVYFSIIYVARFMLITEIKYHHVLCHTLMGIK